MTAYVSIERFRAKVSADPLSSNVPRQTELTVNAMCIFDLLIEISQSNTTITIVEQRYRSNMIPVPTDEQDSSSCGNSSSSSAMSESIRSVRFDETLTVIEASSNVLDDEISTVWYQLEDLEVFRSEARELCRQIRSSQPTEKHGTTTSSTDLELLRDWNSRGLELRSCLERQRRKYLANRYIVKASRKLDERKLASFATRCTTWAATLAREEGKKDFERAYREISEKPTAAILTPAISISLKRTMADDDHERRVQPRVFVIE